ncbi:hypothetical protein FNV43_RR18450 [Rhamnella rubrinervis]|uniref:Uncharacterized protein n=1 Tax=Rhamnella rubrinervis TaxID=2594499 RepID=A0A8K0GW62_9ROSA|nr:hypothetical protein FNV43_RR18450 [Rhamnella rubrinervis]
MSSPYQILENHHLISGSSIERANAQKDADNGFNCDPQPVIAVKSVEIHSSPVSGIVDDGAALVQGNIQEGYVLVGEDSAMVEEKLVVHSTTVETGVTVYENVVSDVTLSGQDLQKIETHEENVDPGPQPINEDSKTQSASEESKPHLANEESQPHSANEDSEPLSANEDSKLYLANEDSKSQSAIEDSKLQPEFADSKPLLESDDTKPQLENVCSDSTAEDVMLNISAPHNQVSEVSPILGSQVKYDSISTDSVSINEKIELKDNIIADHVKLELDVIKPEMVEPSSSTVVPVGGDSHPMDVEEPLGSKASVGEKDDDIGNNADLSKKNDSVDVGYSEKLNLDRSSGDDSMEEDVLESKQIDSKYNSDDVGDRIEKIKDSLVKEEESHVDVVGDDFATDKRMI